MISCGSYTFPLLESTFQDSVSISNGTANYIFPLTETTSGRIYQQTKFASAFHLYPKAGFYDVLKIEVFDKANYTGNGRVIYIPIEIINQNVYFRKIGDDAKVN